MTCRRYHTFCGLAGVHWLDQPANLPSNEHDSIDVPAPSNISKTCPEHLTEILPEIVLIGPEQVWPLLSGAVTKSPRTETVIALEGQVGLFYTHAIRRVPCTLL